MSKLYQVIIFDWEGTLGDTYGLLLETLKNESQRLNLGSFDEEIARASLNLGLVNLIRKVFPQLDTRSGEKLLQAIQRNMPVRCQDIHLIPGARDFIECVYQEGIHLAIASNKSAQSLQRCLESTGLAPFFSVTRSASETFPKPNPQMLQEILEILHLKPQQALMVGDSVIDIEMANSIHVDAVGVDFYFHQRDTLMQAGALKVFHSYTQLKNFLKLSKP